MYLLFIAFLAISWSIFTQDKNERVLSFAIAVLSVMLYILWKVILLLYNFITGERDDSRTANSQSMSSHQEDTQSRLRWSNDQDNFQANQRWSSTETYTQPRQGWSSENDHGQILRSRTSIGSTVHHLNTGRSVFQKVCDQIYSYNVPVGSIHLSDVTITNESLVRSFPYRPYLTNEWFPQLIRRPTEAEPVGKACGRDLNMINLDFTSNRSVTTSAVRKLITACTLENGEKVYYHGADAYSAGNILNHGIDLNKSRKKLDFSNGYGFYVTKDYDKAIEWANRKAKYVSGKRGAVIAFKICENMRKEQQHLSMKAHKQEFKKVWEMIVCHYRNGESDYDLSNKLYNVKFIKGPVSKNASLYPGETPTPHTFTQMCILKADYAKRFGSLQNICFVLFFKVVDNTYEYLF